MLKKHSILDYVFISHFHLYFSSSLFHKVLTGFKFIVSIITFYRLLHPIISVTRELQGRAVHVIKAFNEVNPCNCRSRQYLRE